MLTIILDTNFILYAARNKIDIEAELTRILDEPFMIAVLDKTFDELAGKKDAKLAIELASKFAVLHAGSGSVDDLLLEEENAIIATNDKELKQRLKKKDKNITLPKIDNRTVIAEPEPWEQYIRRATPEEIEEADRKARQKKVGEGSPIIHDDKMKQADTGSWDNFPGYDRIREVKPEDKNDVREITRIVENNYMLDALDGERQLEIEGRKLAEARNRLHSNKAIGDTTEERIFREVGKRYTHEVIEMSNEISKARETNEHFTRIDEQEFSRFRWQMLDGRKKMLIEEAYCLDRLDKLYSSDIKEKSKLSEKILDDYQAEVDKWSQQIKEVLTEKKIERSQLEELLRVF